MGTKRVVAQYMHESEAAAAMRMLTNSVQLDGFCCGDVEESQIPEMQAAGLVVRVLRDKSGPTAAAASPSATRRAARRGSVKHEPPRRRGRDYFVLHLRGPLTGADRKELEKRGVELLGALPKNRIRASVLLRKASELDELPFLYDLELYGAERSGPRFASEPPEELGRETDGESGLGSLSGAPVRRRAARRRGAVRAVGAAETKKAYDVVLHQQAEAAKFRKWLRSKDLRISKERQGIIRLEIPESSPLEQEIRSRSEVRWIEPFRKPRLHGDVARKLLGIDKSKPGSPEFLPLTGKGQIVAVADTGLDESHPDFAGRILKVVARGRKKDGSDPDGHGTHVAGCAVGDGKASSGRIRGTAPGARLFFQSVLDANGELGGLPDPLDDLFQEAYKAGARIHNNSWGTATSSTYTINSMEVDDFVAKHRDMLIVLSAGNAGSAATSKRAKRGYVEWTCLDSPGTCKNALVVGASRSSRRRGGFSETTYGKMWGSDFPFPPMCNERVSGNPECLAGFSSRGPCEDYRIKPDLVAPGTDIAAAKSSLASGFWGAYPKNRYYAFLGGTSMAAPLVAGCAALVREYYETHRRHRPSAALVKATLISGTRWLKGWDATADPKDLPNYHQGFGCVYMPTTVPAPGTKWALEFADDWKDKRKWLSGTGKRVRLQFTARRGHPLRLCLVWTDAPDNGLQNNLDLTLEGPPDSAGKTRKWIGNEKLPMNIKDEDAGNNVEVIRLDRPEPGRYIVQITAYNLLKPPQDFALVVTGSLSTPVTEFPGS